MKLNEHLKRLRKIEMDSDSKEKIRDFLLEFARAEFSVEPLSLHGWSMLKKTTAVIMVLLISVFGISGAKAAESAMPDSPFYPVKIYVTEKLKTFSKNDEERALWHVKLAGRRLEEATVMANNGRLNNEVARVLENNFRNQIRTMNDLSKKLKDKKNLKAISNLEREFIASMNAYDEALATIAESKKTQLDKNVINNFISMIEEEILKNKIYDLPTG